MPLPIVHSYAGYSIYRLSRKDQDRGSWGGIILAVLLANLADFDFFPGIFVGEMGRFHRGFTHSLGAAFLSGAFVGLLVHLSKRGSFLKIFTVSFAAYFSHIFLDFFSEAGSHMPIFWPLSSAMIRTPVTLFIREGEFLHLSGNFSSFLNSFFSWGCLRVLLFEMACVFLVQSLAEAIVEFRRRLGMKEAAATVSVET